MFGSKNKTRLIQLMTEISRLERYINELRRAFGAE